jgi:hypothetical protein
MRKTNTLTKQRFQPQVSAVLGSVSILIDAYCVDLDERNQPAPNPTQGLILEGIRLVPLLRRQEHPAGHQNGNHSRLATSGLYNLSLFLSLSHQPRHKRTAPICMMLPPPLHCSGRSLGLFAETCPMTCTTPARIAHRQKMLAGRAQTKRPHRLPPDEPPEEL